MLVLKIGVLISGRGSNLQAIIDACEKGEVPAQVAVVISNKADAYGLERAKKHGIPAVVLEPKDFKDKDAYEKEIIGVFDKAGVGLVCLAGYMRIVGQELLKKYQGKMINIHPALLPSFPGLHGQKQALDYGVKVSGVTVHFVDEGCDTGPVILQTAVPVLENDTEGSLSDRILEQEHKLYPMAVKLIAEGKLRIKGRKVQILK
ncbi:MAG: phosphoribosylglycinamide formyltransferase [Candidatus Saganbacteria bacterium]|nr:phosphoribosylglycinamide formyltransferase [Candidatus Saganbacteria bacterium]